MSIFCWRSGVLSCGKSLVNFGAGCAFLWGYAGGVGGSKECFGEGSGNEQCQDRLYLHGVMLVLG